mgnify:CR=1 FL=1
MKKLIKMAAVLMSAVMLLGLLTACNAQPISEAEKKIYEGSYEEIVNSFYEDHKETTAGAMVGIFDNEGTIFEGYYGYSDLANEIKVDENTVIDWGSTTKLMVWVSVMQLWEQGKIDLTERLDAAIRVNEIVQRSDRGNKQSERCKFDPAFIDEKQNDKAGQIRSEGEEP